MPDPLVSIIVPCYNAGPWLAATLESALAQTWPRIEIIAVNDGSADNTLAVASQFAPRGVKIIDQSNQGASAARNHGLRLANGEYVQFLDADDLISPEKISLQMQRLLSAPSGHIASGEWARFATDPATAAFITEPNWRDMSGLEFQLLHYEAGWMMQPAAWLCPRSLLNQVGPWNQTLSLNDDGEYFNRVMLAAAGILFCAGARTYYRSAIASSLSRRSDEKALRSLWETTRLNGARLLVAAAYSPRAQNAVANGWQRLAFELYPVLPALATEAEAQMRALGGTSYPLPAGPAFLRLARFTGWRLAKRLRDLVVKSQSS